jgi:hypothetical protein
MRKKTECRMCSQKKQCEDSFVSWVFFIIGLIATVAIRIVTVVMEINEFYGKITWYIGVGGFFIFFVYKYKVNKRVSQIIEKENLIEKTRKGESLTPDEYKLISEILCSLKSEKERINYLFIFAVSAIAMLVALYFDFFKSKLV